MRRTLAYQPGHPNADRWGWIFDYRLKAAETLEKTLPPYAVVHHHWDGSLVLCEDEAYHNLLEARSAAFAATGNPHKRKCRYCKQYDNLANMVIVPVKRYNTSYQYHRSCYSDWKKQWWIKNKDRINQQRREQYKEKK